MKLYKHLMLSIVVFLYLIVIIMAFSKIQNIPIYTHPQFKNYLDDFISDSKKYNKDLDLSRLVTIFSDSVSYGTAAYCIPNYKLVVVSTNVWETLSLDGKKALLYHEWGHCILRRNHTEDYIFSSLCPVSIMYPMIEPVERCYNIEKYNWYNKELFTNPNNYENF